MDRMVYSAKVCTSEFGTSDSRYSFNLDKPQMCPHCGIYEDGIRKNSALFDVGGERRYGFVMYECTSCKKKYVVVYHLDLAHKKAEFIGFHPSRIANYSNDLLTNVSTRFVDSYNQALRAEIAGDIELAAIGYRKTLEILIKDYAINELNEDREKVVSCNLINAISDYLGEQSLVKTADVVRILGNDYTHYERKYPEHDFALLKTYLDIFIKMVETKYMIAHPPVERKK
ncbi:MAG: DUF4145 domain-containing protein [Oscillospiraceae bacterium]|nr:DUF4145 domain-containing protein [Oscillospiraceae bacterium]